MWRVRVRGVGAGRCWARVCGIGGAGAVLHIRSGPAGGGLAESCGNASVFNAVEVLPCAEGAALHMGARPLKTGILEEPRNHAENPESVRGGAALQCATPPHGPGEGLAAVRQPFHGGAAPPHGSGGAPSRQVPLPSDEASTPATGSGRLRPARQRPSARPPSGARSRPNPAGDRPHRTAPDSGPPLLARKAHRATSGQAGSGAGDEKHAPATF